MILTKENIRDVNVDLLISEKIDSSKLSELLLIVPTNRKARNLKKEFISRIPNRATSGLNIETLGTISTKLLSITHPFKQLSEAAATVFIRQSTAEIELKYFSLYKNEIPFGALDRIKNVISEYKRQGISPNLLRSEAEKLEKSERLKALDIADIYENYCNKCFALNAYEAGDIYSQLNQLTTKEFIANFRKLYDEVDLIIIDGFNEFSNPEIEIIQKLSSVGNTKLFLRFDYSRNNKSIFSHLDKCYDKLYHLGFINIEERNIRDQNKFHKILRDKLFNSQKFSSKIDYSASISKIIANDREKEIELIAREIKKIITYEKCEPHRICLAFNLIQNYSSTIKDVFEKNGLPYNLSDRTPLDNANPVTAIVNFLEIAENDFYFKNIFRALSSGFIDTNKVDVSNLYRLSSELKIVSGKENWVNSLKDAIANLDYTGDDDNEGDTKKDLYNKALSDIQFISELLKPFDGKLTIEEFHKRFREFIVKTRIPFKLLSIEIDQEKNVRAFTDFLETMSEIFQLLSEEYGNEKVFAIDFYMDQIRTACNWARFNVKEKSDYGVQVTTLDEIRGLEFDYLFISGLCDGDLPTRYSPEIFFSGSFKKQARIHQTEERYRFYQALCTWKKKLFLTYPLTESGREVVVSTFLDEFEEVFSISSKNENDYDDIIFSNEDLQTLIGKNGTDSISDKMKNNLTVDLEKISRSLEIDKIRNSEVQVESPYSGNISSDDPVVANRLNTFKSKQYSISQLETYAKCPFKFFVERVLGIETIEEPTEDIEAIEMGRLLHSILYEFYSSLREKKIKLINCDEKTFQQAEKLIFEIATDQLQLTAFRSPLTFYEREKILGLNGNKKESILYKFLETERKCEDDFIPMFFEVSFGRLKESGSDKILSDQEPIIIDNIKLRGKIDRIEINEKIKSFNIVDYKLSGAKPSFDDLKNGISLQLPIYLFAASELLSRKFNGKYSPNEMFIYSLKYAVDDFGKDRVTSTKKGDEIQSVEQLVDKSIEHVKNYVEAISKGKFHLSKLEERENKVCRFCQFRTVCRIDEVIS
ncbi:MAG: exodeoxyribonuclease V subunit gamma [Ignavibacteriales bacterium]|nr:exodeoxyribonuclease V subunit gamma [Ignavibacteriales bacterium]